MLIINLDPKSLTHYSKNAKKHPPEQIDKIAKQILALGFTQPVVVDADHVIAIGHGRTLAAIQLNLQTIPCIVRSDLSQDQLRAMRIADNKVAESEWDISLLKLDLEGLNSVNFDLLMTAFSQAELDKLLGIEKAGLTDEDAVPEQVEPRAKLGDIYKLGEHRLLCGDSTSIDAVEKLMNGEKADMVFTDPPYGAGFEIKNDEPEKFENIFKESMNNASTVCNSTFLICCYYSCIAEFVNHMKSLGFNFNEKIVWVKNLFGQGKVFHRKHEDILFFSKDNHLKENRNKFDDVMNFDSVRNFMGSKNAHEAVGHPTQKPTQLICAIMEPLSTSGYNIYDPFGGSGSTLIACEKTNRRCFMMELDPHYIDIIISRWEQFTGKKAELINAP